MIFNRSKKPNTNIGFAVRIPKDIVRGMKQFPELMTDELCPKCWTEVKIKAYGKSTCPNCGAEILPCSMCDECHSPCVYWLLDSREKMRRHTEKELFSYLSTDWYEVETDDNGHKIIHALGYAWDTFEDEPDHYRIFEYCGVYLDPERLRREGYAYYEAEYEPGRHGIVDCNKHEILEFLSNLAELPHLPMTEVTDSTPEGMYCGNPPN